MYSRYCRSLLCTPAIADDRFTRCHRSGADICMVDLEDSVPVPRKSEARRKAAAFFEPAAGQPVRRALRINSLTELDGLRDLIALRDYRPGPSILLIPKVESGRDLEIVERALGPDCPGLELLAIVETPRGFEQLSSIVSSSSRLRAVIFGSAD